MAIPIADQDANASSITPIGVRNSGIVTLEIVNKNMETRNRVKEIEKNHHFLINSLKLSE